MPHWDRLSALDASFLHLEDANTQMHMAAVLHVTGGSLVKADGAVDIARLRHVIHSKLHRAPRLRTKLAFVPYEGHPVWIDDESFDIASHVRVAKLSGRGGPAQLKAFCGTLMSRPLDRDKPMWELWAAEGYADGGLPLILKVHHCMVDGVAGTDLMMALFDTAPQTEPETAPPWQPQPAPTGAHLAAEALQRRLSGPWKLLNSRRGRRGPVRALREAGNVFQSLAESAAPALKAAPKTPLNGLNGPHRTCDWVVTDLAEVKAVSKALGCKVNDVVLTTVAGALQRFFAQRKFSTKGLDLRALVPVNARAADDHSAGNQVASLIAPLPITGKSPVRRLRNMTRTMQGLKRGRQSAGVQHLETIADHTMPELMTQALRLAARVQMYNLIVTNVPGPQVPLYLYDAQIQSMYPLLPLFRNQGLGLALFSYDGALYWGLQGDRRLLHDLATLPGHIAAAFAELRDAALPVPAKSGDKSKAKLAKRTHTPRARTSQLASRNGTASPRKARAATQ